MVASVLATVPDLPRCARCNSAGAGNVARVPPPHNYNAHNREGLESRLIQPKSIKRPKSVLLCIISVQRACELLINTQHKCSATLSVSF